MSRKKTLQTILSSEFFWFGGLVEAPKVYDSGTRFSAGPTLRRSEENHRSDPVVDEKGEGRQIRITETEEGLEIEIDPV
jgi:hypothetical protein